MEQRQDSDATHKRGANQIAGSIEDFDKYWDTPTATQTTDVGSVEALDAYLGSPKQKRDTGMGALRVSEADYEYGKKGFYFDQAGKLCGTGDCSSYTAAQAKRKGAKEAIPTSTLGVLDALKYGRLKKGDLNNLRGGEMVVVKSKGSDSGRHIGYYEDGYIYDTPGEGKGQRKTPVGDWVKRYGGVLGVAAPTYQQAATPETPKPAKKFDLAKIQGEIDAQESKIAELKKIQGSFALRSAMGDKAKEIAQRQQRLEVLKRARADSGQLAPDARFEQYRKEAPEFQKSYTNAFGDLMSKAFGIDPEQKYPVEETGGSGTQVYAAGAKHELAGDLPNATADFTTAHNRITRSAQFKGEVQKAWDESTDLRTKAISFLAEGLPQQFMATFSGDSREALVAYVENVLLGEGGAVATKAAFKAGGKAFEWVASRLRKAGVPESEIPSAVNAVQKQLIIPKPESGGVPGTVRKGVTVRAYKGMVQNRLEGEPIDARLVGKRLAGYFTDDRAVADSFNHGLKRGAAHTVEAELRFTNPLIVDANGKRAGEFMVDSLGGKHDNKALVQALDSGKYDGLIIKNTSDEGTIYAPLGAEQISKVKRLEPLTGPKVSTAPKSEPTGVPGTVKKGEPSDPWGISKAAAMAKKDYEAITKTYQSEAYAQKGLRQIREQNPAGFAHPMRDYVIVREGDTWKVTPAFKHDWLVEHAKQTINTGPKVSTVKPKTELPESGVAPGGSTKPTGEPNAIQERPQVGLQSMGERNPKAKATKGQAPQEAQVTGLANQVQEREAINGVLDTIESTKGKNAEHWQARGKKLVDDGEADPGILSEQIGSGDVELTGDRVGVLLEGKRQLLNRLNVARKALDESPGTPERVKAYDAAREELDTYLKNVQQGKGRWSDVGRALQAGTDLDTGDFASVIAERTRIGSKVSDAEIKQLTEQVKERDARIAELEKNAVSKDADREFQRQARQRKSQLSSEQIATRQRELRDRLRSRRGLGASKERGAVSFSIEDAKDMAELAKLWLIDNGGKQLNDFVEYAVQELGWKAEDIVGALASRVSKTPEQKELTNRLNELRAEAKRVVNQPLKEARGAARKEATRLRNLADIENEINDLASQLETGRLRAKSPQQRFTDKRLQELRAERAYYSKLVLNRLRAGKPRTVGEKVAATAGNIRGTILGSDIGILLRQGLFTWAGHPIKSVVALGRATKSAFSEKALARFEHAVETRRVHGELAAPIRQKMGLQLTDTLNHREELIAAKLFRKVPGLGKLSGGLERFQSTFINSVRADVFDSALAAGFRENELKTLSNFINSATGRSNIKNVPTYLQAVMTSPRYEVSRWEMLMQPFRNVALLGKDAVTGKGLNRAALTNIKDMAATAGVVVGTFKLAELAGYTVDWNPTSSDFLKMRKGDEVWDISAGIAPRLRDCVRAYVAYTHPDYKHTLGDIGKGIGVRTISPGIRLPAEQGSYAMQRRAGVDKPVSPFSGYEDDGVDGFWRIAPLIAQQMKQSIDAGGWMSGVGVGLKEFVGTSVNRYPVKDSTTSGSSSRSGGSGGGLSRGGIQAPSGR